MSWKDKAKAWVKDVYQKAIALINKGKYREENILDGLDLDPQHLHEDPEAAEKVQKKYMDCMKQIEILKNKYRETVEQIALVQRIEMLDKKIRHDLESLCQIYSETLIKKGEFKEKVRFSGEEGKRSAYLEKYENSIEKIIAMMAEHESNQSMVKQDLAYLEAEKSDLLYQSKRLKKAYSFVRSAFIIVALITAFAAFILTLLYFVYNVQILVPAMFSMVAVIAASVWVYVFRRYLKFEIVKNQKLMKRAIELLNKTKIKYINNQKVIDYQCKKYQVDSSEMLELRWENLNAKRLAEKQYININNSIAATITDIDDLLKKYGIDDKGMVLDHTDYFATKKGRKVFSAKLTEKKEDMMISLKQVEKESQVLNLLLTSYKSYRARD